VRLLRDGSVDGRLSTDTFARRVGLALVGRAPSCDCVVPEECVSRRHAQIWREGERWYLRELGSRNGTRVNGTRVIERVELRPGDRVSLGGATYRVRPPA